MRWAFWRGRSGTHPEPPRALPDDVGLPTTPRPPAAPRTRDPDEDVTDRPATRTPGAALSGRPAPDPSYEPPVTAPAAVDVDRTALAAAGLDVADAVRAARTGTPVDPQRADARTLALAATGALAARLPALSGVDGAVTFDEPEDELLHAYADVLAARAQARAPAHVEREDLLAVAHLAAAAAAVDGAADPALLLLAGVPADTQLRAAVLLLAQTAADGGGAPARLAAEVRELFGPPG